MKKFFIYLFLSCSLFIVISCFYRKGTNKQPVGFQYILNELKDAKIGFEINNDIELLTQSMKDLNTNTSYGNDMLNGIVKLGKTIYYGVRFLIQFAFHSLIACLNVVICVLRVMGFETLQYITSSSIFGSDNMISVTAGKNGFWVVKWPWSK